MFGRIRRGRMIRNVICGVWVSFYTSCCAGILHSPASVVKIVAGREERRVRLVCFDKLIVNHQSFRRNGCKWSMFSICNVFDSQTISYFFGDRSDIFWIYSGAIW